MTNEEQQIKLMTERQLAKAISVSLRTARRLRARKVLPYYKLGNALIRYDQKQCFEALNKYRVKANGEK